MRQAGYVLTIFQEGSISAAAKKLSISQSALSQSLRLAEETLGAPIFERGELPLKLTYAGECYIDAAKRVMQISSNLEKEIGEIKSEQHGRLRFSISPQRAYALLPAVLPDFMKKYPQVDIVLCEQTMEPIESLLRSGEVDIAVIGASTFKSDLIYYEIEQTNFTLLCDRRTKLAREYGQAKAVDISVAADEHFVALRQGRNQRTLTDNLFMQSGISPHIKIEVETFGMAKWLTVNCQCVMVSYDVYSDSMPGISERGITIPLKRTGLEQGFYVCHRRSLYLTRYMRDWITIIVQKMRNG